MGLGRFVLFLKIKFKVIIFNIIEDVGYQLLF